MFLELKASEQPLVALEAAVNQFASREELPDLCRHRLNLILEELVQNVLDHGRGDQERKMEINLQRKEALIRFRFRDNGQPFNPLEVGEPNLDDLLEDRPVGGMGLHLIQTMAREMEYRFADGWNELSLSLGVLGK